MERDAEAGAQAPRTGARGLCLVFGATGYVGGHLVPRLLAEGLDVRAAARSAAALDARGWPGVEKVVADALVPESLEAALRGVEVAYYLVHSMAAGRHFGRLDRLAAANFAWAAGAAGVRRIVYLGGLVPPDATSEHIVSRQETGDVLRDGSVAVTELRAGIIVGPGSAAFEVMRDLVLHLPVIVTPRWVRAVSPPVALSNLLEYLVRLPWIDEAADRTFAAGVTARRGIRSRHRGPPPGTIWHGWPRADSQSPAAPGPDLLHPPARGLFSSPTSACVE